MCLDGNFSLKKAKVRVVAEFVVKMDGELEVPLEAVTVFGLHKWPRGWDEFVWLSSMLR